jgi:hypothetical protein
MTMDAAALRSTLFAGATEAEVNRRIGRLRLFNVAMGVVHAAQGAAVLVLATSFTLGDDHAVRSTDRMGGGRAPVHHSHRSPGDRVTHDLLEATSACS